MKTCSEEGCERTDIAHRKTGRCNLHYSRVYYAEHKGKGAVCRKEDCDLPMDRRGMCAKHFRKWAGSRAAVPWVEEPYETWKAWRFSREFTDLEERVIPTDLWDAMLDAAWQGVPSNVAAMALAEAKPAEEKAHPWNREAMMR